MGGKPHKQADPSVILYGQCWEDTDILIKALKAKKGDICVSIASAGDNSLSILTQDPALVVAVDQSQAQLYCLEVRMAAMKIFEQFQFLELMGSSNSSRRLELYKMIKNDISEGARVFWNKKLLSIENGIASAGRFENYFRVFRQHVLPLIHTEETVKELYNLKSVDELGPFYSKTWNNWKWQMAFDIFFSRQIMGWIGREPSFFRYVEGQSLSRALFKRAEYALTRLLPRHNPYMQWILSGIHLTALPYYLRKENYNIIKDRLDRMQTYLGSIDDYLDTVGDGSVDCFNLSDIFEYMSVEEYHQLLQKIVKKGKKGARLVYWNMMVSRKRPDSMAHLLRPLPELSSELHAQDKSFFYGDFVVEEII